MMAFELERTVSQEDLDELEHVNNVRYVQWIQDISKAHWESRAPEELKKKVIWVVRQHLIRYHNAARMGERILMRTHIAKTEGALSTRVVEMHIQGTDKLLLRSETQWCLLHGKTLRPMRIPKEISSVFT